MKSIRKILVHTTNILPIQVFTDIVQKGCVNGKEIIPFLSQRMNSYMNCHTILIAYGHDNIVATIL